MTGFGYSLPSRRVIGHVRLAPDSRHQNWDVGFGPDFVRCTADLRRLAKGPVWSEIDPKQKLGVLATTVFTQPD